MLVWKLVMSGVMQQETVLDFTHLWNQITVPWGEKPLHSTRPTHPLPNDKYSVSMYLEVS